MSKNPSNKREIIELQEVPRSSTPEPVPKRPRTSRSTSKAPVRDSRRSEESGARATRGVIASAEGLLPAVERSSEEKTATVVGTQGPELRTPAVERSSGEETVTEGLFPTAERSLEEGTSAMQIDDGHNPWTLDSFGTRDQRMPPSDGRLGAVLNLN